MQEMCNKCGLPRDLCACETISKEAQKIRVSIVKRRFGKIVTLVEGLDEKTIDIQSLAKTLKSKLACGGTMKSGRIELQGNHKIKIKALLIQQGFDEAQIEL